MIEIIPLYQSKVPFELAIQLKEVGFDTEVRGFYPIKGDATGHLMDGGEYNHNHSQVQISAPTYGEVMDWLMGNGIFIQLNPGVTTATITRFGFSYTLNIIRGNSFQMEKIESSDFASFFLCMKMAIEKSLEIIDSMTMTREKAIEQYTHEVSLFERWGSENIATFSEWLDIKGIRLKD